MHQTQIQEDGPEIVVVKCEVGWFARCRSQRLAAVGKSQEDAYTRLKGVLDTMSKLTEKRILETLT